LILSSKRKIDPDHKNGGTGASGRMDAVYAPDGIRAFYGVFLKWAFWETGRFAWRSGFETFFLHDAWISLERGILGIIPRRGWQIYFWG
jgi:hypothetical protein